MSSKNKAKPLAVFCADIHLSDRPPVARSLEPDWFASMALPLYELGDLANELNVPIFCAGDIFDSWRCSHKLVNFALRMLPNMIAVAGQHDLPNHDLDQVESSPFKTLQFAGTLISLPESEPMEINTIEGIEISCFSWGMDIIPNLTKKKNRLKIALCHKYIWKSKCGYEGASKESRVTAFKDALKGYDFAFFGDNHIPFEAKAGDCRVINCGGFMRRKVDEIEHKPSVVILFSDGSWERHYLNTSADNIISDDKSSSIDPDTTKRTREFIRSLEDTEQDSFDFKEALFRYVEEHGISKGARNILLKAVK